MSVHIRSHSNVLARHLSRRQQLKLIALGSAVGLAAGVLVALYRLSLHQAETILRTYVVPVLNNPVMLALWVLAVLVLSVLIHALVKAVPDTAGSGIPQVDAEVMGRLDQSWASVVLAKFTQGTLGALAGLSLGREGPAVQLGAMMGKAVSRLSKQQRGVERLLVTCGAAAGMSAAFHAPLTGVLFALEEIHKQFSAPLIISVMTSSVVADYTMSQVLGISPVIHLLFVQDLPHTTYLVIIALAVMTGIVGALHNRGMFLAQKAYARIEKISPWLKRFIPFIAAAFAARCLPAFLDGGDALIELVEQPGTLTLGAVAFLLVGKYIFTATAFGAGIPGGTLFPLVVMGSLTGALYGHLLVAYVGFSPLYLANFVVLGVAGLFASVVRAPVTAIVLVFELTGSLDALLSVSIVSIISYVTANILRTDGFYEHLLGQLLERLSTDTHQMGCARKGMLMRPQRSMKTHRLTKQMGEDVSLMSFKVGMNGAICGMSIREVPWPDSCHIASIERSGLVVLPTGDVVLEALDELVVLVKSDYEEDAALKLSILCGKDSEAPHC